MGLEQLLEQPRAGALGQGGRGEQRSVGGRESTNQSKSQLTSTITYANYAGYDAGTDYVGVDASDAGPAEIRPRCAKTMSTRFSRGFRTTRSAVTRLRGDLAHAALAADLVLQASADQSVLPGHAQRDQGAQ